MQWSPQQERALAAVADWLKARDRPVFRLFGFAGTGKTTLARHVADGVNGDAVFAAFTGKAAHVMRNKGCRHAGTIHSLIYRPEGEEDEVPTFVLHQDSAAGKAALIVIDECSMVDEEVGRDLLSFGVPVLVLGDPAQLPPVAGGGFFTDAEPDAMLTEVHRQAQDDPIVRLSMQVRAGERLTPGEYGRSSVVTREAFDPQRGPETGQILVGRNATRRAYNTRMRERRGFDDPLPLAGDKLVCLRNNRRKGLFNGGLSNGAQRPTTRRQILRLRLIPDEGYAGKGIKVSVRPECFTGKIEQLDWQLRKKQDEFDYGYVLTVHKAQGSQWDDVVLFDESFAFPDSRERWLYTGITRAAKRLTVVV